MNSLSFLVLLFFHFFFYSNVYKTTLVVQLSWGLIFSFLKLGQFTSSWGSKGTYEDFFSHLMVLVSGYLLFLLSSQPSLESSKLVLLSSILAIAFFIFGQMITMFVLYEASLIPIVSIILLYGKQPERLRASKLMMLYTMISSVPFLSAILQFSVKMSTMCFSSILFSNFSQESNSEVFLMLVLMSFLVKVPLFFLHSWLPKAHVEASLSGSVLLAGTLLKMGTFGITRVILLFGNFSTLSVWGLLAGLASVGSVVGALLALFSSDLKVAVACSSVSHMNFSLLPLLTFGGLGLKSLYLMSLSHSMTASLLFFIVTLSYSKSNSRSIILNKGGLSADWTQTVLIFCSFCASMGVPPFASFLSEVLGVVSSGMKSVVIACFMLAGIFVYSFFGGGLFGSLSHSSDLSMKTDLSGFVVLLFLLLIGPVVLCFLAPKAFAATPFFF